MKVKEKLNLDFNGLMENGPINIVAFGDSVTHGAVGAGEIHYDTVYYEVLKRKLHEVRNYVPINMINAGVGGDCASGGLRRFKRDVLAHNPDLVIVCFGLNDVNGEYDVYINSLKTVFEECKKEELDVIFMTPNMLNTYFDEENTYEPDKGYAKKTAEMQTSGRMDRYIYGAVKLAEDMGITVCDCYSEWKKLYEAGEDTTKLLANRINHPTREMHNLFADKLFEIIMEGADAETSEESTMYRGE